MLPALPQRRSATALRRAAQGESTRTIIIALVANIVIATAKLIGGLVSGSTGMLAEAAHSAADSVNEILLAVGLHRDRQPADAAHPVKGGVKLDHRGGRKVDQFTGSWVFVLRDLRGRLERRPATRLAGRV